ncbi:MAG TPA: secretin N-terminal domain-containing protein [Pirellulales bacterium]|nr:secretin N-terminal domain-containing protein [Pirellulales bacterium]
MNSPQFTNRFVLIWSLAFLAILLCGRRSHGQAPAPPLQTSGATNPGRSDQDEVVRAYTVVPPATLEQVCQQLTKRFPASTGVRISPDERTSQILVVAPAAIQEQVGALLQGDPPATDAAPKTEQTAPNATTRGPKVVPLSHLGWREFEASLNGIFGKPLPVTLEHGGDWARYVLETRGGRVDLIVDRKAGQVALEGPVKLADAWARIVQSLDNHPQQANDDTRVVTLNAAKTSDVIKALSVLRENNSTASSEPRAAGTASQPLQNGDSAAAGRFINMIFQPKQEGNQADAGSSSAQANAPSQQVAQAPTPPLAQNPNENQNPQDQNQAPPASPEPGGELIGPVQIEFLEGLDAIVVRGNPRDVERVMQIINQIEQLSTVTQPRIEIYPLKFVNGQTLYNLIQSIYSQTLAVRQGPVSITPLVKPNSLLLIGRDEAVQSVIDLIKRLDQPVNPSALFQVFPLKHASATAAQQTVNQFFVARGGLGGTASVVADFRSNSLIVQASPRDLQEVEALLKKLDTNSSPAVNELRIFPLKNSVAEELAQVLETAINPQAQGAGARGQQNGQQGFPGTAGGANNFGGAGGFGAGGANGFGGAGAPGGGFGGGGFPGAAGGAGAAGGGFGGAAGAANQQQNQQQNQQRSSVLHFEMIDGATKQAFSSGILSDVHITADSRANTLLVSAPSDSMELIAALIRQLDQMPSSESQIKVFEIRNGDAVNLIQMLETLFGQTVRTTTTTGGGGAGGINQGGAIEVENILVPVRFSADERTNSIIASGSASDLAVVEAILLRLDESDVRLRKTTIYRLKNVAAVNVANSITTFLTQQRTLNQEFQQQGATNPFSEIDQEVIVVAEPTSNSLIISATPRYYDEIMKVVEQIDKRPPMVMIQVLIAEVTLNNTDEFGVELGLQDSVLFDRSLVGATNFITRSVTTTTVAGTQVTSDTIVGADNNPGFNFNNTNALGNSASDAALANPGAVGAQGLTNLGLGRANSQLGYGGLVLSASSDSVSALLRALSECRRTDILSRPQIMTLDNQPAFLQVGQQVPRVTSSSVTATGTINTVTLDNVGIILEVQPRVSPDNLIVMSIDAEKSSLGPEDQGIPISINTNGQVIRSPFYNTTLAQTTVQAVEGQTIVLAGLITSEKDQDHRRVPYLSNIPLLGNLFRYDLVNQQRTELLIVLTPHVVRNEDDADRIKQAEAARMSWCLGDVIKLNGPSGLRTRKDDFSDSETTVVYPELHPDGSPMGPDLPKTGNEELPAPSVLPSKPKTPPQQPTPAKSE